MTLHLPDDLSQPFTLGAFGDQHRLQRVGIVGKRCDYHELIEI